MPSVLNLCPAKLKVKTKLLKLIYTVRFPGLGNRKAEEGWIIKDSKPIIPIHKNECYSIMIGSK